MIPFRKIIAVTLIVVTIFSITVIPASATIGDATDYTVNTLWDYLVKVASGTGFSVSEWWRQLISSGDSAAKYDDYVNDVKTQTGTATVIDGGIRVYIKATKILENGCTISSRSLFNPIGAVFNTAYSMKGPFVYFESFSLPFDCSYSVHSSYLTDNCDFLYDKFPPSFSGTGLKNKVVSFDNLSVGSLVPGLSSFSLNVWVDCKPYVGVFGDYYNIDLSNSTRPTVIIGDVGYYDASNNLQVINNTTIVNETNNTYYNPITNTTTNVTNWVYDYSTRTYTLTLEGGVTVTVGYGNDNIIINEGGTTYNVYYVVPEGGGSGGGDTTDVTGFLDWWKKEWADFRSWLATALRFGSGSDCEHTYTSAVERESACTEPGLRTYTCTKCGHTYTELIDALDHDWTVTGHVDEVLDEVGNVVEKGYDKLTCSRCDAESKDYGEGPVESDIFDALGDLIADGITWILDKLTELADSLHGITDVFTSFVEKVQIMPGEYPLFFAAFVAIIPEDLSTVLWFSVIVFVVVAVWKKWSA